MVFRYDLVQRDTSKVLEYELAISELNREIEALKRTIELKDIQITSAAEMVGDAVYKRKQDQDTIKKLRDEIFELKNSMSYRMTKKI
jgi:hypothetical protein